MVNTSLNPTWTGHVATTRDALMLFEACLNGTSCHVPRRPHDRERSSLIRSGSVFIYEENASGIKRWTDGVPWSPSRILGNFLVYRELTKPFPPGEKKRATKRSKRPTRPGEPYPRQGSDATPASPTTPGGRSDGGVGEGREGERALIGSLVDSYGFKDEGLVKKTMSVNVQGVHHHLVSYYTIDDVLNGELKTPSQDQRLANIEPRHELIARQNFRAPLDDHDPDAPDDLSDPQHQLYHYDTGYDPRRHAMSYALHSHHPGQVDINGMYSMSFSTAAPMQPSVNSYAPAPSSQAFYPTNHTIPQPTMPHSSMPTYSQPPYATQYSPHSQPPGAAPMGMPNRSPVQVHPPSQGYSTSSRHNSAPGGILSRPNDLTNPINIHEAPPRDANGWSRGASVSGVGVYGPTASTPHSAPPAATYNYPTGQSLNGQQLGMPPPVQSMLPMQSRNQESWPSVADSWPLHNPSNGRQSSYSTQHI
ncbi:hypothetical protein MMC19_000596 [Ptychographa xylographoides]|nr:hypothetical protein [Ptychographa xylographoides]